MLDTPTDTAAAKRALVRTYQPPGYADPWECIQDYERVQRYHAEHPNKGSQAVSTALDLPRSRIRPWLNGSQPDCYRGLQTALTNDWIIDDWHDTARGLNRLAAWLLASGSINETWVPLFIAEDDAVIERLRAATHTAGVALSSTREDDGRPLEWRPRRDASVLGRVLHTWTGIRGDKSPGVMQFPQYPQFVRQDVARAFAETYVSLRAVARDDTADARLQIQEDRSKRYRESLVELLQRVVTDASDVRGGSWPVYIVEDAVTELQWG